MNGMRSQDIVVLLKLVSLQEQEGQVGSGELHWSFSGEAPYSVRGLESLLGISKTRLTLPSPQSTQFYRPRTEICVPRKAGGITRGMPTAFAAPMLKDC
ncbi:hypothetical protein [Mesorhizobium sp. M0174]|uniref:hypothetical protein n=1 Tax=Mesorhizobium sp. M0174 TaxID=2956904 RepID=UPI003336EFEA